MVTIYYMVLFCSRFLPINHISYTLSQNYNIILLQLYLILLYQSILSYISDISFYYINLYQSILLFISVIFHLFKTPLLLDYLIASSDRFFRRNRGGLGATFRRPLQALLLFPKRRLASDLGFLGQFPSGENEDEMDLGTPSDQRKQVGWCVLVVRLLPTCFVFSWQVMCFSSTHQHPMESSHSNGAGCGRAVQQRPQLRVGTPKNHQTPVVFQCWTAKRFLILTLQSYAKTA